MESYTIDLAQYSSLSPQELFLVYHADKSSIAMSVNMAARSYRGRPNPRNKAALPSVSCRHPTSITAGRNI